MELAASLSEAVARVVRALVPSPRRLPAARQQRVLFTVDALEPRCLFSAALDLIGVSAMRVDPVFSGIDGSGMTVAVIDTGVDFSHPLLKNAEVFEKDIVYGGANERLVDEHGTHVAGILGARNNDIGVAPGVGLIGLQVFTEADSGGSQAYDADIEEALAWVLANHAKYNIVAVNMSLGGGNYLSGSSASSNILYDDVKRLESAGITVVSAAGNSYGSLQKAGSAAPAVFSTLDVGAVYETDEGRSAGRGAVDYTTGADRLTYFTQRPNTGNQIFAPGAYITSTVPGGGTKDLAGTSMAAPMVSGVVALMQEAAVQFGGRKLSPNEVQTIIRQTADSIVDGDDEDTSVKTTGATYLRVNAYSALTYIRNLFTGTGGSTDEVDPNGTIATAVAGPVVSGTASAPINSSIGTDGSTNVGGDDVDLYRINVTSPGNVSIVLNTTAFQGVIRVFSAAGAPVDMGESDGVGGLTHTVSLNSGIYYVGISSAPNSTYNPAVTGSGPDGGTGAYSLSFALDSDDPDGVLSGATPINLNAGNVAQALNATVGMDGTRVIGGADVDFYRVSVPDDGVLLVDIDTPDTSTYADTYLRVFDEEGKQVSQSDDQLAEGIGGDMIEFLDGEITVVDADGNFQGHTTDSFIGGDVVKGTVYYIAVGNYDNRSFSATSLAGRVTTGSTGAYNLFVSFRNGDVNGAISLAVGNVTLPIQKNEGEIGSDGSANGLVQVGDRDVDFIKVSSPTAGILKLDVDAYANSGNLGAPVDAVVRLFSSNGTLLGVNDDGPDGPDPLLYYTIDANKDYYIAVSGKGNDTFDPFLLGSGGHGDTGDYYFSASVLPLAEASSLSNDSASDGGVAQLLLDADVIENLGDDGGFSKGDTDVDLYRFTAPFTGEYVFTADPDSDFGADTFLRIFDPAGVELAKDDNGGGNTGGSKITLNLTSGQAYLVGVTGAGPNAAAYNPITGTGAAAGDTGGYSLAVTAGDRYIKFANRNTIYYTDADGTEVALTMNGPGSGTAFFEQGENSDATRLLLEGTTDKTTVTIRGASSMGQITLDGSLKALSASSLTLTGGIAATGTVRTLQLANMSGAKLSIAGADVPLALVAGDVTDCSIDSQSVIKSIKVNSWTDSASDDVIAAPSVIAVTSQGTFAGTIRSASVGKLKIGGALNGSVISGGNIDSITADTIGKVSVFAGVKSGQTALPDSVDDFDDRAAAIKSLTVRSKEAQAFGSTRIAAPTITKAILGRITTNNGSTPFGLAADFVKQLKGTLDDVTPLKLKNADKASASQTSSDFVVRLLD